MSEPVELVLKPGEERRLLGGHAWAFSNELKDLPKAEPGSLALLRSSSGGALGLGFYNPRSLIAFRLLSRSPARVDEEFLRRRLEVAWSRRAAWLCGRRSLRLCFGESDGLPGLVADKYEDVLVLQILSAGMERLLGPLEAALRGAFSPKAVLLKNEHPARSLEGLELYERPLYGDVPASVVIEESGLRFEASLLGGQKTGFYFDQSENRAFLAPWLKGRRVLDLFCYTGGFALHAARAGAAQVLGLDSSAAAVEAARRNARLNGLQERCAFDEGDAQEVLETFASSRQPIEPDAILLDPPSYAPSRRHLPKALKAYARLAASALRCLKPGGLLAMSTCTHHVDREAFVGMLQGAAAKAQRSVFLRALRAQAQDHPVLLAMPETQYLHFALLEVA